MKAPFLPKRPRMTGARAGTLLALACSVGIAAAQTTGISNAPLFTATAIKPNILFIMDDSGSMKRNYLPDSFYEMNRTDSSGKPNTYGMQSTQCNGLAFNPAFTYSPPPMVKADNTLGLMPNASTTGLEGSVYYVYNTAPGKGTQPRQGWEYYTSADAAVKPSNKDGRVKANTFFYECNSVVGEPTHVGMNVFLPVLVTSEQLQNYANWKLYYSTRMDLMKSAVKRVFSTLDAGYRVGFSTTSKEDAEDWTDGKWGLWYWRFLNIKDYDNPHRKKFFTAIDEAKFDYDTPLRGAFAKAGQYFANKALNQNADPVQQSCQRNFAIMATDGGWTKPGEKREAGADSNYGPYQLDRTTMIGPAADRSLPKPMKDSGLGTIPSLADVTAYYYNTDLRTTALGNCVGALGPTVDVCKNNVKGEAAGDAYKNADTADWQHMTAITIGLGLSGEVAFSANYRTEKSGEFKRLVEGSREWPDVPDTNESDYPLPLARVDDMWHASVNGHGQHFSANDPDSLVNSLAGALNMIKEARGAASAASTSSMQPVEGDNDVFVAQFTSQKWSGDVLAYQMNPATGVVSSDKTWSAQERLDAMSPASRRIFYKASDGNALKLFNSTNLAADGYKATYFDNFCSKAAASGATAPAQCASLSSAAQALANNGDNMISFIAGNHGMAYYRERANRLGDIINASPAYIGRPRFPYADSSYQAFKTARAGRQKVVLAGANDGMLHAFDKSTGNELWAYIPTFVMPNLYKLADTGYPNNHVYFVDGSPQVGDIKVDAGGADGVQWKTIVVGGLNAGGRGYYALDVTDPADPKLLWEFSHANLGLTFGNPIITKRDDGTWVVVFASGYNNVNPGDGNGHLFVLNAWTGALQSDAPISTFITSTTKAGSETSPSGLAKINVWVDSEGDNVARRFYGGDLKGNLWRFDIDNLIAPTGKEAFRLAQLTAPDGSLQPVTTKPTLAEVRYNGIKYPMVYVGTGRYLGGDDVADTQVQSIYAIKEPMSGTPYDTIRGRTDFVSQTITAGVDASSHPTRVVGTKTVDFGSQSGWRVDFPVGSERVTVNPVLALDTLYVAANLPRNNTCEAGGSSFLYRFDIKSGKGDAEYQEEVLIQGVTLVELTDGSIDAVLTRSDGTVTNEKGLPPSSASNLKRSAWREIVD